MRRIGTALVAGVLAAALPAAACAQGTAVTAADDPAKLAEAHAIITIMFPPERREQMFEAIMSQIARQIEAMVPSNGASVGDAGADAIAAKFRTDVREATTRLMTTHLPALMEANAVAYTHLFSLDELKQIHAFAATPAGDHYLSRASALVNDPAYVAEMSAMGKDTRSLLEERGAKFRADLQTYFEAHPDAAKRVAATVKQRK